MAIMPKTTNLKGTGTLAAGPLPLLSVPYRIRIIERFSESHTLDGKNHVVGGDYTVVASIDAQGSEVLPYSHREDAALILQDGRNIPVAIRPSISSRISKQKLTVKNLAELVAATAS